jgi:hypothetical protein
MKSKFVFILIIMVTLLSCAGKDEKKIIQPQHQDIAKVKPSSSFSDTMVVSGAAAVFYYPDSLQDLRIKAVTDSGVYKSTLHEMFYQIRYSKIILKKYFPHIKIVETRNARYLLFKKAALTAECIDLNTKNDARGMYIFDGKQLPRLVDMTNVETELGFYLKNNKPK